ncbi:MAG: MotA/TolQ/ExbB proton channel family protein [Spirochaetes bacterium]|nr:MotA/TolQ/ExbB proton channel family protein [Spirochaetota bacterium]
MLDIMLKGGVIMWPVAFLGLVALVIIIERYIFFKMTEVDYNDFKDSLLEKIEETNLHKLQFTRTYKSFISSAAPSILNKIKHNIQNIKIKMSVFRWNASPYTKIAHEYVINVKKGEKSRNESLRRLGSEEIEKMEKYFKILSAISTIAPLLGLLGTVVGIIQSFQTIQQMGGQVDVNALAGGIWVAMITTAAGLIVAIPAQMGYLFFDKRVTERSNRMSYIITYLNEKIFAETCNLEISETIKTDNSDLDKRLA